jgi:hypothetical protein
MALRVLRALWACKNRQPLSKLFPAADGVVGFLRLANRPVPQAWLDFKLR